MPDKPMTSKELTALALEVREAYQRAVADTREMAERLDERSRLRAEVASFVATSADQSHRQPK
jgi:hypothetical protein